MGDVKVAHGHVHAHAHDCGDDQIEQVTARARGEIVQPSNRPVVRCVLHGSALRRLRFPGCAAAAPATNAGMCSASRPSPRRRAKARAVGTAGALLASIAALFFLTCCDLAPPCRTPGGLCRRRPLVACGARLAVHVPRSRRALGRDSCLGGMHRCGLTGSRKVSGLAGIDSARDTCSCVRSRCHMRLVRLRVYVRFASLIMARGANADVQALRATYRARAP